ncbi:MAG: hypothetical protein GY711_29655 [bacterium]|nr:hypothetical protein [bacterium]
MIHHEPSLTRTQLRKRVDEEKSGWLARAQALTDASIQARKFVGTGSKKKDGVWSEIKRVFMSLQGHKCAYCEKRMPERGKGRDGDRLEGKDKNEYDIEHYRPKNAVKAWPSRAIIKERGITYADEIRRGADGGYYLLGHDPRNYVASCKTCNSAYKGNYFPIAGQAARDEPDPKRLRKTEQPLLPLPFGSWGEDPTSFIRFLGPLPIPRFKTGHRHLRAAVTIDFFELDTRADLLFLRSMMILLLWEQLENAVSGTPAKKATAATFLAALSKTTSPHTACTLAFASLHATEHATADSLRSACHAYVASADPSVFGAWG